MKNILICPLDWGLGHATRVRHIAHRLHQAGHNVTIAASSSLLEIFDNDVCSSKIIFSSLRIRYSARQNQYLAILLQFPFIFLQFLSDHYRLGWLVKKHSIDIVISDNRFGAWSKKAMSIYITHQLNIMTPGKRNLFSTFPTYLHRLIISQYNECWIPDVDSELTGMLSSYPGLSNVKYIGPLSMLITCKESRPEKMPGGKFYAVIVSGPEPQRTILETKLSSSLVNSDNHFLFVGGNITGKQQISVTGNISSYNYLSPGEIKYVLTRCEGVICRGGYSTIMDLVALGKGAIIIPTPGQTEQEYLADYLDEKGWFKALNQSDIQSIDIDSITVNQDIKNLFDKGDVLLNNALESLIR